MVTRIKTEDPASSEACDGGDYVESLASIAASAQADAPAQPGTADAVKKDALEISTALELVRAASLPFAPVHVQDLLLQVWSDAQLQKIAECMIDLCKLHGLTVGDFFGQYGPYLQLLATLGMPALATLKILKMQAPGAAVSPPPPASNGQQQPA